jgi:hypothetical protein
MNGLKTKWTENQTSRLSSGRQPFCYPNVPNWSKLHPPSSGSVSGAPLPVTGVPPPKVTSHGSVVRPASRFFPLLELNDIFIYTTQFLVRQIVCCPLVK